MAKTKRFMDGGYVPPNQYPFANNPNSVQVGSQQEPLDTSLDFTQQYARGGKVKKYADGGSTELTDKQKRLIENVKKDEYARQAEKPYNAAMRNTPPAPKEAASAPAKPPVKKAGGGCAKGYAKGGMIDGCAQRGKTKCKIR